MGYCIQLQDGHLTIKAENKAAALEAVKRMDPRTGHGWWNGEAQFSWVDHQDVVKASTLEEALGLWHFPPVLSEAGDIIALEYEGEKIGDEIKLFATLAPFVENGSHVEFLGEDGERWRYVFDNGGFREQQGETTWRD
jgi:hypothetical protein